jgi:hypothetical protein
VRNRGQGVGWGQHELLVAAVIADTWNLQILAIAKVSPAARETRSVVPSMPSDADALSDCPSGNTFPQFIDDPGHFVSRNARVLDAGQPSLFCQHIAVAYPARLHLDSYLSVSWLRDLTFHDLEIPAWF